MSIKASDLLKKCTTKLLSPNFVRWSVFEMLQDLNDGQVQIVAYKPDANVVSTTHPLEAGKMLQDLPDGAMALLDVVCNTAGGMVSLMDKKLLQLSCPHWASTTATEIEYYAYSADAAKLFYVYPVPLSAISVDVIVSKMPTSCNSELTESCKIEDVTDYVDIGDEYSNALYNFILYRAYSKDADFSSSARAALHLQTFENILGVKASVERATDPNLQKVSVSEVRSGEYS